MPTGEEEKQLRRRQMMMVARDAIEWCFASMRNDKRGMKRNAEQIADTIHNTLRMHVPLRRT